MEKDFVELTPDRMKEIYVPSEKVNNIFMSEDKPLNCLERKYIEENPREQGKALDVQIGGNHYKKYKIQPMEYAMKNNLNACQFNIVKYVTRYKDKNGLDDLKKAKHCIDIIIQMEYEDVKDQGVQAK